MKRFIKKRIKNGFWGLIFYDFSLFEFHRPCRTRHNINFFRIGDKSLIGLKLRPEEREYTIQLFWVTVYESYVDLHICKSMFDYCARIKIWFPTLRNQDSIMKLRKEKYEDLNKNRDKSRDKEREKAMREPEFTTEFER